jgi:hypothetical protein
VRTKERTGPGSLQIMVQMKENGDVCRGLRRDDAIAIWRRGIFTSTAGGILAVSAPLSRCLESGSLYHGLKLVPSDRLLLCCWTAVFSPGHLLHM